MPNLKIFVDDSRYDGIRDRLSALLPQLRDLLCDGLEVPAGACQLAVLPVMGLPDQPGINAELQVMPRPARTRERLQAVGEQMRDLLAGASGLAVAVRIAQLDGATYLALK